MVKKIIGFFLKSIIGSILIFLYICYMGPVAYSWSIYGLSLGGSVIIFFIYELVTNVLIKRVKDKYMEEE